MSNLLPTSKTLLQTAAVPTGDTLSATGAAAGTEQVFSTTGMLGPARMGDRILVEGWGRYSASAISLPTLTPRIRIGGVVVSSLGITALLSGASDYRWEYRLVGVFRSVGVNGSLETITELRFVNTITSQALLFLAGPSGTANDTGSPVTIDTTKPMPVTLSASWSLAQSGNSVTVRQMTVITSPMKV